MFKVFCDDVMIADSRVDDLAISNAVVTSEVNAAGQFVFTMNPEHPYYNAVHRLTSVIRVERDGKMVFQGFCSDETVDFFKNKTITCDGDLAYLNDSVLRPQRFDGATVQTLLNYYIAEHNSQVEERKQFEVGIITVTDPNNYIYCYTNMNPTLEQIKGDLVDDLGGYMRLRYENGHRYIDYLSDSPRSATQTIKLGVNLLDYTSNINEAELATRVIPLGCLLETQEIEGLDTRLTIKSVNSNSDYLESQTAINNFGIITKVVVFDDITTASRLKTKGQKWLTDNQFENVVIEVSAVDFGMITNQVDTFQLLDNIHVISDAHGMDKWFILTKMVMNLNNPEQDVYTLGKKEQLSISKVAAKVTRTAKKTADKLNEAGWLERAKKEATDLLNAADGGYVVFHVNSSGQPYEILVMNTNDISTATQVWRWNKNGLGYFPNGMSGTVSTAITMNGEIVADFIKTGTMRSVEIANGGTSVSNAPFKVDASGNMTANSATIKGSISGSTITGSSFDASGTVKRYKSNYSASDNTRINNIIVGNVVPTDADYEKYDLNSDGIIDLTDTVIVRQLREGVYGDYYELSCPVTVNGSNQFGKVKTEGVSIHNKGITTECLNIKDVLTFEASAVYASGLPSLKLTIRDNGNVFGAGAGGKYTGLTGTYNGFKILNGLIVGTA